MAYTPVEIPRFRGLDLRDDPQEVGAGAAIDMLDIDLDAQGRLRSRDGYASYYTPASVTSRKLFGAATSSSSGVTMFHLLIEDRTNSKVIAKNASTGGTVTSSALAASTGQFTHFGTGTTSYVYGSVGTATNTLLRWDPSGGFTYPASGYAAQFLAVQRPDNRLVLANQYPDLISRVRFSDAGAPETFTANSYVDITPNDGEQISGIAAYRDLVVVFKETKFAVFYGNSIDSSGNPVFNYRWVDVGIGVPYARRGACCVGRDGVYFVSADGVYRTTGDVPVKVSAPLDPLFRDVNWPTTGFTGSSVRRTDRGSGGGTQTVQTPDMVWHEGRLYLAIATGSATSNDRVFVLDPDAGWLSWAVSAQGMTRWLPSQDTAYVQTGTRRLYFTDGTSIYELGPDFYSNNGVGFTWNYRTGFLDLGAPGAEKIVREWLIDGAVDGTAGAVTVKAAINDSATLGSGAAVTLGAYPTIGQGRDRRAVRARNVSLELSGATTPETQGRATVSRVVANVMSQRPPGPSSG